jgi:hypothetical protein
MSTVLVILAALSIVVLLVGCLSFLALIYHRHFKRKGYVNPFIMMLFPLAILSALLPETT